MDRNHYYRILGLRSDATPAQIKAAYDSRIARLNSADYNDEPEYARRKKEQATKAYKVLIGAAPATTQTQKKAYFEKFKDAIENREGMDRDDFDDDGKKKVKLPKIAPYRKKVNKTANKAKGLTSAVIITFVLTAVGLVSTIAGLISEVDNDYYPDYEYTYLEEIVDANNTGAWFSYYDMLDTSTRTENIGNVDWNEGVDEYGEDPLFTSLLNVLYCFDIYDAEEFYSYVTDDADFYMESDDYTCAAQLVSWILAPDFSEIAGATDLYTGEPILSMSDYMEYLEEFIYAHI